MNQKNKDETRKSIAAFLPDAIAAALKSYEAFSGSKASADVSKEFKEHHSACKVAIAHIELLIKLANWAELPDAGAEDTNGQIILAAMMQQAEGELSKYREKNGESEE